ncbi:hypothetical protein A7K69_18100 [Parageobacillus thermoglucosidasius]|uniref:Uncharacterized protein n=1 Tax=Parageobacillus thermoglucosidasius TaxID=1426 RepID=A0A1B7KUH0_PARTM|nr:hypothetical protein [Parageobacillus thermoglucosidasius]OAT73712.1 hypothetical protein A7K69_18100 [Parageobacillus thermoglucosidasius]
MFEIVGRLRCPICSEPVQMDEKVFLDIINTVIHQKCYYQSSKGLPIKDEGSLQKMFMNYLFFFFNELF